tara:strand:- start:163 stop:351 length:189 start_codon:yes stop_codon:yes gene_type:complete
MIKKYSVNDEVKPRKLDKVPWNDYTFVEMVKWNVKRRKELESRNQIKLEALRAKVGKAKNRE